MGREKEVLAEADRLDIKDKAPLVLAEVLFDNNALQQIKTYTNLLKRVCRCASYSCISLSDFMQYHEFLG